MARATTTAKTANCRRCRALLTNPRHVADRITPHCLRKERAEKAAAQVAYEALVTAAVEQIDTTAFKDPQAVKDKAVQLILDRAIVPTRIPGMHLANGSDGVSTYLTDTAETSCTCKGFSRHKRCNHIIAAAALDILPVLTAATSLDLAA